MNRIFTSLAAGLFALAGTIAPVSAQDRVQERILAYDSLIQVNADGSLDITENIRVHAAGGNIRRGIYRDFPTHYKDRFGNRVVVGFKVLGVQRDGHAEPWFTEKQSNGVRINTGNDDLLPVPADYSYTLRYHTTRQLGFFKDHDELYFNAIGTGWDFAIEQASVEVRLPTAVPVAQMSAEAYTGSQGTKGQDYRAEPPAPGIARWTLIRPLAPREGMTVVLSFPKGIVAEPSHTQKMRWLLKNNSAVLIALGGLALLLWYCIGRWRAVGRDPKPGVVIVRYDPPDGCSPADLRFVERMGYDQRCFSSELLACAVDGHVCIHRDKKLLKDKWRLQRVGDPPEFLASAMGSLARKQRGMAEPEDQWRLENTGDDAMAATTVQRTLLAKLFPGGASELELDNSHASTFQAAIAAHTGLLKKRFVPVMFDRNLGSAGIAALIAVASIALALLIGKAIGSGPALVIAVAVLMLVVLVVFTLLVKAYTEEGRKLLDAIEGFRRYLGVAERDELAAMPGPDAPPVLDAKRYEHLLPYAVALEVEDAWTRKFTLAVGAAAAAATTAAISWYQGGHVGDLGSLTQAIGSSLTSQIASASTPPGSSSGSGGGGSSGGGGGGGGGGGR